MQYSNALNEARVHQSSQQQQHYYTPSKCGSINRKVYNYDYNNINTHCTDETDVSSQYCNHGNTCSRMATPSSRSNVRSCNHCDTSSQCGSLIGYAAGVPSRCSCRRSSAADLLCDDSSQVRCYTPPNRMGYNTTTTSNRCCTPPSVPRCGWPEERPYSNSCSNARETPRARPLSRERRSKSGQWNRTISSTQARPAERSRSCEILDQRRSLSSSAPDLLSEAEICHTPEEQSFTSFHTPRKLFY